MSSATSTYHLSVVCLTAMLCLLCVCPSLTFAQESCYEQYLREHNMTILTAEDADDSYDEQKKDVLAYQFLREEVVASRKSVMTQPILLAIDTITGICHLLAEDDTIFADAHLAMVDSIWYMWLSVDPLADKFPNSTPYIYCSGNPIRFIDPDGKKVKYSDETGDCKSMVDDYCSQSEMFNAVYRQLEESNSTYTFLFDETVYYNQENVDGQFIPCQNGGIITLNRNGAWSSAIPEEIFHALQQDNRGKYVGDQLNLEFEAKVFVLMSGLPAGSYPGMEESYRSSLVKMDLNEFILSQSISEYIKQANVYSTNNKHNAYGNKNYWVPTTISPYNLISIIKILK